MRKTEQADERATILVVDDMPENLEVLIGALSDDYRIKAAKNGEQAIKATLTGTRPDLILLDVIMPQMDGYETCKRLKANPLTENIPIIFVTARDKAEDEMYGFEIGAEDYVIKPISPPALKARVKTHLELSSQRLMLQHEVSKKTKELEESRLAVVQKLGKAAEYKDNETGLHIIRMSQYAKLIAQSWGASEKWCELIALAAPMHDIGKIGIAETILTKEGKLTTEEWDSMTSHPEIGADILGESDIPLMKLARSIALTHHEKWNGSGYPKGLKGEEIPVEGRIAAVADVFDALVTPRPYKKAWEVVDAVNYINENSGEHFDPVFVEHFNKVLPQILAIKSQFDED